MEFLLKQGRVLAISQEMAQKRWLNATFWGELEYMLQEDRMHFSKAEVMTDAVIGEVVWYPKDNYEGEQINIVYYLDEEELVLIGEKAPRDHWEKQIQSLITGEEDLSPTRFFIRLLDELLKDDIRHLQWVETKCFRLEEEINRGKEVDATNLLARHRKLLLTKSFQYQQLMDMSDSLAENINDFFSEKEVTCFLTFGKKIERLHGRTQMLREYMIQISELQQQLLDEEQNRIMRILTIVTTLFAPLTLIAGWYGMNFEHMPELQSTYGYLIVAIVCVSIIVVELIYFKRRKLF